MLNIKHFIFAIDLASLASRREYLNLEKWLQDKIREHGEDFVTATVEFLCNKVPSQMGRHDVSGGVIQSVPLSIEAIAIFIKVLQQSPR
jgi:CCR4-NOT transcription complex subunit 1